MAFSILFEDHKNLWVYQKCLHSTVVMADPQNAQKIIFELIMKEEKSEERKQRMLTEVKKLFEGMTASLDARARENVSTKFTAFKSFIFDMNSTS